MMTGTLVLSLCSLLLANPSEEERYEYLQRQMGVPFSIVLYAPSEEAANDAARAAYARVKQLNLILSDYEPESELMRLCKMAGTGEAVPVSPELYFTLERSQQLSEQTDGAFDVTVGPLMDLWRTSRRTRKLPEPGPLAAAKSLLDYRRITLDSQHQTVRLERAGMRLDLGGIAKGHAADEALATLRKQGITRALVAAAGDIVAGDPPPGKPGWQIGIASAAAPEAPPEQFVTLKQAAVSTSGDAFQHVEIEGVRYSHILDPRTGLGLTIPRSVTVIAPDGITADSLATALCLMGQERGFALIDKTPGTAAQIVELHDGTPQRQTSKRWPEEVP